MYARSITIMGDPERLDEGIAYVRDEVMPTITALDGCVGLSMLVDRGTGAVHRDELVGHARTRCRPATCTSPRCGGAAARSWAVRRRSPSGRWPSCTATTPRPTGSCCRVTWMRLNHTDVERGIDVYRAAMLPEMESIDGVLQRQPAGRPRRPGRACNTTTYDSRAALEASRERSWTIRDAGIREPGVDVLDVVECDLALAHLRLPELV